MKFHRAITRGIWSGAAILAGWIGADMRLAEAQGAPRAAQCPKQHAGPFVPLDPASVPACIQLRDESGYGVLEITPDVGFASGCPTPITDLKSDIKNDPCLLVDGALMEKDMLRFDDWGDGEMTVTLRRGNTNILDRQKVEPVVVRVSTKDRLIGYKTSKTFGSTQAQYRFYLEYYARKANGYSPRRLEKRYRVEVFGRTRPNSPATCESQLPEGPSNATLVDCDGLAPLPPGEGQLPSGGGGEPPKPKP